MIFRLINEMHTSASQVYPSRRPSRAAPALAAAAALLAIFLFPTFVQAQTQAAPTAASAAAPAGGNGVNAVTQAAVKQGALACASRINQVSNFLGFGPQAGAMLMMPPSQPDQRLIPLAMEVPAEGSSAYVSAAFAPNQANGCGAAYDAVVYWPQKCEAVAAKQFASLKRAGQLKTNITMLDGGPATKVFLMPAGSGCVSIKKEVVL
jgi:hypothetical protein